MRSENLTAVCPFSICPSEIRDFEWKIDLLYRMSKSPHESVKQTHVNMSIKSRDLLRSFYFL